MNELTNIVNSEIYQDPIIVYEPISDKTTNALLSEENIWSNDVYTSNLFSDENKTNKIGEVTYIRFRNSESDIRHSTITYRFDMGTITILWCGRSSNLPFPVNVNRIVSGTGDFALADGFRYIQNNYPKGYRQIFFYIKK
jgi:hypothetical protein